MKRHPMTPIDRVKSQRIGLIVSLLSLSISACAPSKPSAPASPPSPEATPSPSASPTPKTTPKPSPSSTSGANRLEAPVDTGSQRDREPESYGGSGNAAPAAEAPAKTKAVEVDPPAAKPAPREVEPAPRMEPKPRVTPEPRTEDPAPPKVIPSADPAPPSRSDAADPEPPAPKP